MADTIGALAALPYYFPSPELVRSVTPLGSAGGWSGSRLWRVSAVGNALRGVPAHRGAPIFTVDSNIEPLDLCLRRWPPGHPSPQHLAQIHTIMARVARDLPAVPVPQVTLAGGTFVQLDGHLWELVTWQPGQANYRDAPSRPRLRGAMQTLARFHDLAGISNQTQPLVPPAVADRLRQWHELRGGLLARIEQSIEQPLGNPLDELAPRLFHAVKAAYFASQAGESLREAPRVPLQPAIRDVHHDHVLFSGDEVTGLVDFGAMRIDTPLADVARLVRSLAGDDAAERDFALAAYAELRPLSAADRRLIAWLDETGAILSAFNWLHWLYVERRDMGEPDPILRRLDELLLAVTKLVTESHQ